MFYSDVGVDAPLARTLEVTVRTMELWGHTALEPEVSRHTVPVRVEALALWTLVLRLAVSVHERDCLQRLGTCVQTYCQTPVPDIGPIGLIKNLNMIPH